MPVDKTSSSVVAPLRSRNAPLEPERPTPSKPATSASTAWQPTTAKLVRNEALFLEREGHFFGQPELASLEDAARNGDPAGRKSILGAVPADGVVDADDQREMALSLLEQLGGRQTPVFGIEAFQQKYGSVFADASVSEKYPELPEHRGVHALGEVDTFDGRKQLFAGEYLDPSTKEGGSVREGQRPAAGLPEALCTTEARHGTRHGHRSSSRAHRRRVDLAQPHWARRERRRGALRACVTAR